MRSYRLMRQLINMPPSVISSHSMHLGVLATASHAIATGTFFSVYYKPRISRSEFIVSLNKYLKARSQNHSVGMKFKMSFEGEEVPERRFSGTIVGVGDDETSRWHDSEWRSLKVQWDEPSSILCPDRVSPWELEPLAASAPSNPQPPQRNNRARPSVLPTQIPDISALVSTGMWKPPIDRLLTFSYSDQSHGQDLFPLPKLSPGTKGNFIGYNDNSILIPASTKSMYWTSNQVEVAPESFTPVSKDTSAKRQGNVYRLFGIELLDQSTVEEISSMVASGVEQESRHVPTLDTEFGKHSDPSNIDWPDVQTQSCEPEKSCVKPPECHSRQIRSCTKVQMHGIAVGRAVDLTRFNGYEDLLKKLEEIFEIEGELCGSAKKWQVVYTDDEDDMMMVGDVPWHELCSMVRKISIYTTDEAKSLSPKKLPVIEEKMQDKKRYELQ